MDSTSILRRAASKELRRLGFTRTGTSDSGSNYYHRIIIDTHHPRFGEEDTARLATHYHPTVFYGSEFDISGFIDLDDLIDEIKEAFDD